MPAGRRISTALQPTLPQVTAPGSNQHGSGGGSKAQGNGVSAAPLLLPFLLPWHAVELAFG